ncbi:MAG: UDP-3-O-(3-hydroxymyristoyl)glucosamine N-acyltransferase [Gammaproteobacteria bacterium]|nr:UDP-3-O-(3-hydroxymyristoyl)glucosamine N-acyltransferase [Gammaproteobacteria bacterium]MDP2140959.1 UDP-3-O-(3-hydroxymyristoyl)glucosamine N-acyltransferase [Gammaproteobacteria bacterium]MDP2349297.1 UDP-3-O-(3-hydroxymyristoyl)glucosamine N-acyltransferase [Gammaproteobacteria bacterium]
MSENTVYTLGELATLLAVELRGDPEVSVDGLATLRSAVPGKLSFLSNPRYVNQLADCKASAIILEPEFASACQSALLISSSPYVTYAKASQLFQPNRTSKSGIHPSANVHPSVVIGANVSIACNAVIDADAVIGDDCVIGAGCYIGERSRVGDNSILFANVSLYHDVVIGTNAIIHSSVVIGADGFGFAFDGRKAIKIAQLGGVTIGDNVEIGAGSTIDRGALDDTVVEDGVKIDNQVQIAHNCVIGAHTIVCGCSAIAGSTVIGKYCTIGGGVGVIGHLKIADKVMVSAMSLVSQSIHESGVYSSGTGLLESKEWKRNIVRFRQLDDMAKRLRELEKQTLGK